jgi:hypothetical protein
MKKVLSLVLVIAMVLSSMSFAFAGTFEDVTGDYEDAINTLVALGVVTGYEDGTYRPEKVVTRAEMAKLMVEVLGYGDLVAGSKSNFADTQGHWADAYIALAAGKGIVVGDGNGNFRPDATVSYNEAITMVVRGLGYTDDCNEIAGMTWPTNFKVKAAELDLTDDVAMNSTGADRGGVAQLLFNALEAVLVTVNSDGDVIKTEDKDEEYVLLLSRLAEKKDIDVTADSVDEDSDDYLGDLVDLAPYMYENITAYLNDDDYVVYVKDSNSVVVEGTVDSVTVEDVEFVVEDAEDDLHTFNLDTLDSEIVKLFYNGAEISDADINDIEESFESIKVVGLEDDANDNGKIDRVNELTGIVVLERTDIVRVDQTYVAGKAKLDGLTLPVDNDDDVDLTKITVKGDAESLEDIEEDDIVVQYSAVDDEVTTLVVTRNTVEGKITKVSDADTFSIDGTSYDLADMSLVTAFDLGDEGVFYLDQEGDVADYDGDSVGPTDYAVVLGVEPGDTEVSFGKFSVDTYPQIKLATQDGEEVIYDILVDLTSAGAVDDVAEDEDGHALVVAGTAAADGTRALNVANVAANYLIQYKLDSNDRISEIDLVKVLTSADYNTVDLDKTTNTLVENAIIFDAGDDYAVVGESSLPTEVEAYVVRNSNGEIEVLVAEDGQVDEAANIVFAYIYDTDRAYDNDGEEVQNVDLYTAGADMSILSTDDDVVDNDDVEGVFAIKYDGELIDLTAAVTTTGGITLNDEAVFGASYDSDSDLDVIGTVWSGVAESVNAKSDMIELEDGDWYALSDNATIVSIVDDAEDGLADLYDVEDNNIVVFINADGDVDLILVY